MTAYVPASTSIKVKGVNNVPLVRLMRRRTWMLDNVFRPGAFHGSRNEFGLKCREMALIEDRLEREFRLFARFTLRRRQS